jgi:hypothetical protein
MKNAVITYIFGSNQEILREPKIIDVGVDYICVTDQPNLVSNRWTIVYDDLPMATCLRDKMPMVKYNSFKYTNADNIIVVDGTIQIVNSLLPLFNKIHQNGIVLKKHIERDNLDDEINAWITMRGMSPIVKQKFNVMALYDNINLSTKLLIESCIMGFSRNEKNIQLGQAVLKYMKLCGYDGKLCPSNQICLTYLLMKFNIPITYLNQSDYFYRYAHNSWKRAYR